jgi:ribonuclease J
VVVENVDKIIKDTHGRLIIGTFASQVERILAIIKSADKYGKKVVIEGRSMKSNMEIVKHLGLIDNKNIIPLSEMDNIAPDKVVMLVTGAQGEEFAALMRMANGSHKHIKLRTEDTILLSSSIIPTNHASVVNLKDRLYRSNAKIITYLDSDVHASGHGNKGELKWIHDLQLSLLRNVTLDYRATLYNARNLSGGSHYIASDHGLYLRFSTIYRMSF